jgi:hypothetical protein
MLLIILKHKHFYSTLRFFESKELFKGEGLLPIGIIGTEEDFGVVTGIKGTVSEISGSLFTIGDCLTTVGIKFGEVTGIRETGIPLGIIFTLVGSEGGSIFIIGETDCLSK